MFRSIQNKPQLILIFPPKRAKLQLMLGQELHLSAAEPTVVVAGSAVDNRARLSLTVAGGKIVFSMCF